MIDSEFANLMQCRNVVQVAALIHNLDGMVIRKWFSDKPADVMVSQLRRRIGPREWSPRKTPPYPILAEVHQDDMIQLIIYGTESTITWDIGMIFDEGVLAILPPP